MTHSALDPIFSQGVCVSIPLIAEEENVESSISPIKPRAAMSAIPVPTAEV